MRDRRGDGWLNIIQIIAALPPFWEGRRIVTGMPNILPGLAGVLLDRGHAVGVGMENEVDYYLVSRIGHVTILRCRVRARFGFVHDCLSPFYG